MEGLDSGIVARGEVRVTDEVLESDAVDLEGAFPVVLRLLILTIGALFFEFFELCGVLTKEP